MNHVSVKLAVMAGMFQACAAALAGFADKTGLLVYWKMDEKGLNPKVIDYSGNGHDGHIYERVNGGSLYGTASKALGGFETAGTYVMCTNVTTDINMDFTAVAWVQKDSWSSTGYPANLYRCMPGDIAHTSWEKPPQDWYASGRDSGCNVPWSVCFTNNVETGDIYVCAGETTWTGGAVFGSAKLPFKWNPRAWYQVALKYKKNNSMKVYVTEAGGVLGDPVLTVTMTTDSILAKEPTLLVGAGYVAGKSSVAQSGAFRGLIREVSLWKGVLSDQALNGDLATFSPDCHTAEDFLTFWWTLDRADPVPAGEPASATMCFADATGNGKYGLGFGNVSCGLLGAKGKACGGFSTLDSCIRRKDIMSNYVADLVHWSTAFLVRPPKTSEGLTNIIMRVVEADGNGANVPFSLHALPDGRLEAQLHSYYGYYKSSSAPIDWERNRWYLVWVRYSRNQDNGGADAFSVYLTKVEDGAVIGEPVLEVKATAYGSLAVVGKTLQFGAGRDGWASREKIHGYLNAKMDEIMCVEHGDLSKDFLEDLIAGLTKFHGMKIMIR